MFRLRRYRVFLLVAVLLLLSLYHLTRVHSWDSAALQDLIRHKPSLPKSTPSKPVWPPPLPSQAPQPTLNAKPPAAPSNEPLHAAVSPAVDKPATRSPTASLPTSTITGEEFLAKQPTLEDEFGEHGQGRHEVRPRPAGQAKPHWVQQKEHFPIPAQSLIALPTGLPRVLPRIQHSFGRESSSVKADRLRKQATVREAFRHAWNGYKNHSLAHDEVKPISKESGDPFNGWGATLVDSLDTLWIMSLHEEFQEAVVLVSNIDFKTSARKDIPLFETTIRYLGGLIAAHDLSSAKYPILLNKAVELADILLGAFDTPNRMPAAFYNWAPSYASQPHRGSPHTVLAELGSLSVEFTRLAQITKESKYYDAIARITDALENWQMETALPGLWPLKLDASGCKKPEVVRTADSDSLSLPDVLDRSDEASTPLDLPPTAVQIGKGGLGSGPDGSKSLVKRQSVNPEDAVPKDTQPAAEADKSEVDLNVEWEDDYMSVDCEPQGLSFEPHSTKHIYGIGAMGDSTYEYFPKEYALLGGMNPQYKSMYLAAVERVRHELLFRPMTQENHDILFAAKQIIAPKATKASEKTVVRYEATHLGCFAGGMFALGARLFGIPEDITIAEKLTQGCVWAYGSTPVGVMAEEFELVPCDSVTACTWNETKWHEALDPHREERIQAVETYNVNQQKLHEEAAAYAKNLVDEADGERAAAGKSDRSVRKRETGSTFGEERPTRTLVTDDDEAGREKAGMSPPAYIPRVPLSHEKYVAARILEERLPPGYTSIRARDYRLRPEAIESVFIMYRITGDESWRAKGWAMFDAVDRVTKTEVAHAGIKDVTSQLMEQQDTMESFWLAETLKYYYLLFSEPTLISLDDYVLNTEAHPFKRPR